MVVTAFLSHSPDDLTSVNKLVQEIMESPDFVDRIVEFTGNKVDVPLRADVKILQEPRS